MTVTNQAYNNAAALTVGKYVKFAELPAGAVHAILNLRLVSLDLSINTKIRVAKVPAAFDLNAGTPDPAQFILPKDLVLGPDGYKHGMIDDDKVFLTPGFILVAYCDAGAVAARAEGFVRISN
jgi:hypothetical protein